MKTLELISTPPELIGPLEIGNPKQIQALKNFRQELANQEERSQRIKDGLLKKYKVTLRYSGRETREVWATDKYEAEEIAEGFEIDVVAPYDCDINDISAEEIK